MASGIVRNHSPGYPRHHWKVLLLQGDWRAESNLILTTEMWIIYGLAKRQPLVTSVTTTEVAWRCKARLVSVSEYRNQRMRQINLKRENWLWCRPYKWAAAARVQRKVKRLMLIKRTNRWLSPVDRDIGSVDVDDDNGRGRGSSVLLCTLLL